MMIGTLTIWLTSLSQTEKDILTNLFIRKHA